MTSIIIFYLVIGAAITVSAQATIRQVLKEKKMHIKIPVSKIRAFKAYQCVWTFIGWPFYIVELLIFYYRNNKKGS
ncbi:hypothetical protein P8825_14175 [Shouchella clausii]|uniref:hypothetical protein n=1 Tax=Shouchella clausii TaxID=79880 RepID=UPI002DBCF8F1|nr:hypothetical protein [Shouchella clausii]MEB5480710.1 hypothetical protein [Shouchella clausii]